MKSFNISDKIYILEELLTYLKYLKMAVVKVIEVIASSEKSFEEAVQNALAEVAKTVKNVDSIYVKDLKCHVKDNKIISYGAICNIAFRVEG